MSKPSSKRLALHWQILIAIVLAVGAGLLAGEEGALFGVTFYSVFEFIGTLFLNALKMIIVPLIASSMIVGVAGVGRAGSLKRLGGRTLLYYASTSMAAIVVGLTVINIVKPGIVGGEPARDILALETGTADIEAIIGDRGPGDIVDIFIRMVPENVFAAASNNSNILAIIFFSLLFGFFMSRIPEERSQPLLDFWQGVFEVMTQITGFVMRLAPYGVFGLVARVVAKTGIAAAAPLMIFSACVLVSLAFHLFVTLPLFIRVFGRLRPWPLFPAMAPALLTAFSTASSSATLPVTLDCVKNRAGVSNRTASFVLPIGATVNMDGTALYECAAVIFIAQAYGVEMSLVAQASVVLLALVTSVGVAGIPAASLVAIAVILTAVGLPAEAIGVLFVFDRILDMTRTAVNVASDATAAIIVAKLEGETGILGQR
jgi:proton glutamate symport protein